MPRGGKREGAGAKKKASEDLKVPMLLYLDREVANLIRKESSIASTSHSEFVNNHIRNIKLHQPKIISFVNQAGGVAKTTMTMNLGYHLSQLGHRVLLIDLDPQASLTTFMGLESHDLQETVANSLIDENFVLPIHSQLHGMDLVPSNLELSSIELQLVSVMARETLLKRAIAKIQDGYDFILIDCPPNLGILNVIALTASTHVIVPVETQYKSFKGVESLLGTIGRIKQHVNPSLKIGGFIPTMHTTATSQNTYILNALKVNVKSVAPLFPEISRATAFADASMHHQPLAVFSPSHAAIEVMVLIARLIEQLDDEAETKSILAQIESVKVDKLTITGGKK